MSKVPIIEITKKDVNKAKRLGDLEKRVRELEEKYNDLLHDMTALNKNMLINKYRHDKKDNEEKDKKRIILKGER